MSIHPAWLRHPGELAHRPANSGPSPVVSGPAPADPGNRPADYGHQSASSGPQLNDSGTQLNDSGTQLNDSGHTLAEMLVVVGLSVLVMAFVMTTVVFGIRTTTANGARLDDAAAARVAITSLTKNLRAAVSPRNVNGLECSSCNQGLIQSGNAQTLTVLANIQVDQGAAGSAPKKITYRVNRIGSANFGELVEQIQDPAVTGSNFSYCVPGPGCAVRSRVLAQVPWPVTGLFSYYLADGSVATNPATSAVWSVDIVLSIDARGDSRVKPMTSTARVVLPNALAGN